VALGLSGTNVAFAESDWRLDGGLTFSRFEQQIKTEVGGERGERLVEDTELGLALFGTYRIWGPISLGLFVQVDTGHRSAARFVEFDADNKAVVTGKLGGSFTELWVGPLLRVHWRTLFAEFGYGALGMRWDDARTDLVTSDGENSGALYVTPAVAYMAALGAGVPITDTLQAVLRLEYRVRYYDRRDSKLAGEAVHGTQNFTPFVGICWTPGSTPEKPRNTPEKTTP